MNLLGESDIHAVTGVLKLYFRELPEPLFSEASYKQFIDTIGMYMYIKMVIFFLHGIVRNKSFWFEYYMQPIHNHLLSGLHDGDAKEKVFLQLLHDLPNENYYCIVAIVEHLVR